MDICKLINYSLIPDKSGNGITNGNIAIKAGDSCSIITDHKNDAHLLFQGLATLKYPDSGYYIFEGKQLDFSDYRNLLQYKRKIGYIASGISLLSNRTLRENLNLMDSYFKNKIIGELNNNISDLCKTFDIYSNLDKRPAQMNLLDLQIAVMIREISKKPDFIILDRPEEFIGKAHLNDFIDLLNSYIKENNATLLFLSYDNIFIEKFTKREIVISKGKLN